MLYFHTFSMEYNDNAELYGSEYDNYYENDGWYQDEYGEWYQDPNYSNLPKENGQLTINGGIPSQTANVTSNKSQTTINNQNNSILSGTTSANNKSIQNATNTSSKQNER